MIITGCTVAESKCALALARKHEGLYCTVGCHPTHSSDFPEDETDNYFSELRKVIEDGIKDGKVVAVGECGLDYDRFEIHFIFLFNFLIIKCVGVDCISVARVDNVHVSCDTSNLPAITRFQCSFMTAIPTEIYFE